MTALKRRVTHTNNHMTEELQPIPDPRLNIFERFALSLDALALYFKVAMVTKLDDEPDSKLCHVLKS